MKKIIAFWCVLWIVLIWCLPICASAHPGRTDGDGGHYDRDTGEYHYHHGYPAHDHWDIDGDGVIDCPYYFDDKTDHNSNSNSNTSTDTDYNTNTEPGNDTTQQNKEGNKIYTYIVIGIVMAFFVLINCLAIHIDKTDESTPDEPISLPSVFISAFSTSLVFALVFCFICLYKQPLMLKAISFSEMLQVLFVFAPIPTLVAWTVTNNVSGLISGLLCGLFKVEVYGWSGCVQRLAIPLSYAVIILLFVLE